jgi:hypothetical protein
MSIGFLFWLLWLLWLLFGGYFGWIRPAPERPFFFGNHAFILILIFLLGWKVFGFPIQG